MSKQYKTSAKLKNTAKDKLTGAYPKAILITFLSGLIPFCASLVISMIASMTSSAAYVMAGQFSVVMGLQVVFFLISTAASIVIGVLQLGLSLFFLNLACGQPCTVSNLFYGFRTQSNKALGVSAAMVLLDTVCLTPYQMLLDHFQNTWELSWLGFSLLALGIGLVIYVPLSLGLSQAFYLMLDFPERSAKEALKLSLQIMRGHKGRLFYVQISFLPLMFLCLLSFGIGYLWLVPYMNMTSAVFFLDLMNPAPQKQDTSS